MKVTHLVIAIVGIGLLWGACSRATNSPNWGVAYQEMRAKQVLDSDFDRSIVSSGVKTK
jgi:hypothetical protein